MIDSRNRKVCRNNYNVHSVDFTELVLLCESCTGHTAFLIIFIEEVLECDCRKSSALTLYINMLLSLDTLMKTIAETSTRHNTSCKLINDKDLSILNDIVLILVHKCMSLNGLKHGMLILEM